MSDIPDWFWQSTETESSAGFVEVDDADIKYRHWSDVGKPGLLFVHGHGAHSHWWDFIAPTYKDDYQTVALDLSGMGDSDHRDDYSTDLFAAEIVAVADAMQMPEDTVVVAHSFGGMMSLRTFASNPNRFKGLVLVDSGVKHPDEEKPKEVERWSRPKVYSSKEIARSRFRLRPPQQCENEYLLQYIARHSIDAIDEGFIWKFDEELNERMQYTGDLADDLKALTVKCALIYGENSESFTSKSAQYMKELQPALDVHELADAQHHLFLDQPLAFMDLLSSILAGWRAN
ncbi:MAG TPA: alpha/beta hydrolase [Gammaproteobacteria bacterium]|nr:alpha/beta hydrolase [Gammaproteobacteria bacterium]|tara:strand:+ start:347 stop:1210 length:864 start_codon:yes stop_codon:yes gene_type:complete